MNVVEKYHQICEQRAYQRRAEAFGLTALLAPYTQRQIVRLPQQRTDGSR